MILLEGVLNSEVSTESFSIEGDSILEITTDRNDFDGDIYLMRSVDEGVAFEEYYYIWPHDTIITFSPHDGRLFRLQCTTYRSGDVAYSVTLRDRT